MKTNYNRTVQACFIGYVVQAIVNNFVPLLFLTFQGSYGISLQKITLLVTFNFGIQLLVDLASIGFVDRIGYRASMILAHTMAAASVKRGGTALFALLALAGDVGCSSGPTYVGMISGALNDNLKLGIFAALIFPVLMIMGIKMIGNLQKYD